MIQSHFPVKEKPVIKKELHYKIKDIALADQGKHNIETAMENMPVMKIIHDRFQYQSFFKNIKIAVCSHITKETAIACIAFKNAGAEVLLVSSNPNSTQDEVAAALVKYYDISVYGHSEQTKDEWIEYRKVIFEFWPDILLDDGAEILPMVYESCPELAGHLIGTTEQTTSGVKKVKNMEREGILKHPVIAVNSSKIKYMFDNRFGVGQTSTTTILNLSNVLVGAERVVVIGYGPAGKGIAVNMRGMGGHVIVCEVDPIRALEAYMDGFEVMSIEKAAERGSIFVTATGSCDVIPIDMIMKMRSGAILSNCGSGQVEFDYEGLKKIAAAHEEVHPYMEKFVLPSGRYVYVLTQGRVTNLVAGEGNPSAIMDLSFASISLAAEYLVKNKLENRVYVLPEEIDRAIGRIKLNEFEISLSKPTEKQKVYDRDWHK